MTRSLKKLSASGSSPSLRLPPKPPPPGTGRALAEGTAILGTNETEVNHQEVFGSKQVTRNDSYDPNAKCLNYYRNSVLLWEKAVGHCWTHGSMLDVQTNTPLTKTPGTPVRHWLRKAISRTHNETKCGTSNLRDPVVPSQVRGRRRFK